LNRASILRDVKSSTKKAPATKSIVVLGDNESGRTALIAKLQGSDDPKRGAGLEYHYIDIRDDDRDGMKFIYLFLNTIFFCK
jgi:dynein light intermediate chain 1